MGLVSPPTERRRVCLGSDVGGIRAGAAGWTPMVEPLVNELALPLADRDPPTRAGL